MAHPYDVERASDLHVEWCRDLAERMGVRTTHQSGPQMKAVMHELRKCLPAEDVVEIANQFPALERGIFLEGWSLAAEPKDVVDAEIFQERVYQRVKAHHFRVPSLVSDVFWLWESKLGPERAARIRAAIPEALRPLWPD
ncbi:MULTISPECIES: DUF2267 domain-containing protein [unclassified Erythrobacter]|uniref:DUF2267 domain-containing protein n=1 Tax=unclassified Erythrobacter TaxID=2633097 RepID=UPI00076DAE66|nr:MULTISPECIES: DUF2267 domain-containing protein [unclassified Erythrobacter]KWV94020.1 hypothetical protein ASS64_09175 [Erythrobacter sp. AP23]MBO6526642.1 DUF2267 domain-containing protein [Erythrobacter sp.]MBO6529148.1 DUF2267 domain-containing protein [Erythrobacter sp.]